MKETKKFYKISVPGYAVQFTKTNGRVAETTVECYRTNKIPFAIKHHYDYSFEIRKNGKLCKLRVNNFDLYATENFIEITEAEFKAKVDEFMNQIYADKTPAQSVCGAAI